MTEADNIVIQQLRQIRAELQGFGSKLDVIVSMLGTHTDTLYQINEALLRLGSQPEGEP